MITRRKILLAAPALVLPSRLRAFTHGVSPVAGSLLQINFSFNASWASAPANYTSTLNTAAGIIMAAFPSTNVTLTISVGYTEVGGAPLGPSTSGGTDVFVKSLSYSSIKAQMAAITSPPAALSSVLANLPNTGTLGGQTNFNVDWACQKMLGISGTGPLQPTGPHDTSQLDGQIGAGTSWNPAKLVGMWIHEIGHAMGRTPGSAPYVFSHFTAANTWDVTGTSTSGYFSIDGGTTNLAAFDNTGSDPTDFLNSVTDPGSGLTDCFDAQQVNPLQNLSPLDIQFMQAWGYK